MSGEDPFGDIEQLFDQLTQFGGAVGRDVPVDIVEREAAFEVLADLPGRDPNAVQVQLENHRRVHIEAAPPELDVAGRFVSRERANEPVRRSVRLPSPVQDDGSAASYEDGVLRIRLPKPTADADGTTIPVS